MAKSQLILVRVGDLEIKVEAVPVPGTEPTAGRASRQAGSTLAAIGMAQETIVEMAKTMKAMIERAGAARPERLGVEFGLKFSAFGEVIMAGVADEASLKVTFSYDAAAEPAADLPGALSPEASGGLLQPSPPTAS